MTAAEVLTTCREAGIRLEAAGDRLRYEAPSGTFDETEGYDPNTDRWTRYAPMPTARHGLGAVTVRNQVFVISGGTRPGGSASSAIEVFSR